MITYYDISIKDQLTDMNLLNSEAFIGRFLHNALEKLGNEVREEPTDKIHSNLWEKTQKYKSLLARELQFDDDHLRA